MITRPFRPRRSVLYVPAANAKALAKVPGLACDCSRSSTSRMPSRPAPEGGGARRACRRFRRRAEQGPPGWRAGRNRRPGQCAGDSEWGPRRPDWPPAPAGPMRSCCPRSRRRATFSRPTTRSRRRPTRGPALWLWAMIETPRALLNIGAIAALGRDPRRAARLPRRRHQRPRQGNRRAHATPDRRYPDPLADADRAGGARRRASTRSTASANEFPRPRRLHAPNAEDGRNDGLRRQDTDTPRLRSAPANTAFSPSAEERRPGAAPSAAAFAAAGERRPAACITARRQDDRAAAPRRRPNGCSPRPAISGKGPDAMKLYRFLTGPDDSSFCHKVTAALNKGWHLLRLADLCVRRRDQDDALRPGGLQGGRGQVDYHPDMKLGEQ
jgi:citrate lyase subunit beta/citryl-CoA lyase